MSTYHMRRADRAVTGPAEVDHILKTGRFTTIALARGDEPYAVTLSYGYEPGPDGTPAAGRFYLHSAHEGLKRDFYEANPYVCATVVLDLGYQDGECAHEYASAVLRGTLTEVHDPAELRRGMEVLIGHLEGDAGLEPIFAKHGLDADPVYRRMAVLRLDIESVTAKRGS